MFSKVRACSMVAVAGLLSLFLGSVARAEATTIPLQEIELDWSTFAGSLATALAGVIAVAVGVGIGVWMIRLVYRMFKSFARG